MRISLIFLFMVFAACERPAPEQDVEVVDWRDFKDFVAAEVVDFERVSWDGANSGALGIRIAKIKGQYEDGLNTMKLTVVDLGTIKDAAMKGLDALDLEIDRENVEGVQKTREWNGHPGYMATDHQRAIGVAVVENRFVVSVELKGNRATSDTLEDVFDALPLKRLARMGR